MEAHIGCVIGGRKGEASDSPGLFKDAKGISQLAGAAMNKWTRRLDWNRASAASADGPALSTDHHYFAFLSYSHHDSEEADWLHSELEKFQVPASLAGRLTANGVVPPRLTPIFRDRHELAASDDLNAEIRHALEYSRCLIVLCSPAAAQSKWTNAEIDTFKRLHPDGCIIAAVIAGEPLASDIPGREAEECFPPALVAKYNRRGKPTGQKTEPLAADLREGKGGRRIGFLKIVAGILGVGLDDLVQRDHLRRQRRLAAITAGSLLGMFVAIGLAVTAIQARDAARDQRREAEGLVSFMLGDLKEKLEPIGKLDALDGVGSKVLAYYSKQDTSELSDAALIQRSRALGLMAKVAQARGHTSEASALYRQALAGTEEALRRSPDDPERLYDHAQNVFYLGDIARLRGDFAPAEAAYREYKRLADQMVAIDPDNIRWRMEVAYANENLGIALYDERRYPEAAAQFESGIRPIESGAAIDSRNAVYQREFANLLGWVANAKAAEGDLGGAIAVRRRSIAYLEPIIAGSGDVRLREKLFVAHQALGILLASRGDVEGATREIGTAITTIDSLTEVEPENKLWRRYAAASRLELARTLLAAGRGAQAAAAANAGCALVAAIQGADRNAGKWRKLRTDCLTIRSRLALENGSPGEAVGLAREAVAVARQGTGDPTSDPFVLAGAYRLLGDALNRSGDAAGAQAAWNGGLATLPSSVAEQPWETHERERLLARLGRDAEARPLAAKLRAIGYRGNV
jgi:tetratricopeptide (TPR) repeat protein